MAKKESSKKKKRTHKASSRGTEKSEGGNADKGDGKGITRQLDQNQRGHCEHTWYVEAVDRHQTERSSQGWAIKCAPPTSWRFLGTSAGEWLRRTETTSRGRRENEDVGPHAYRLPGDSASG